MLSKKLLVAIAIGLTCAASAQDRDSVDRFLQGYASAHVRADIEWFFAHRDPTALVRQGSLLWTYKDFKRIVEEIRKAPQKPYYSEFHFENTKIELKGDRAIVQTTDKWVDVGSKEPGGCKSKFILVWKDGDWRLWRLDESDLD